MKTLVKKTIFTCMDKFYETKSQLKIGKKDLSLTESNMEELLDGLLHDYLSLRETQASVAVYDHNNQKTYHFQGNRVFKTASTVKVSVMMAMLKKVREDKRSLTSEEEKQIKNMIQNSNNDDTTTLWKSLGSEKTMMSFYNQLGMSDTVPGKNGYWGLTETTAVDQIKLLNHLLEENNVLTSEEREYALSIMENVHKNQNWGISGGVTGANIAVKNGWSPRKWNDWRINSIGCVYSKEKQYTIAIFTENSPTQNYGIQTTERISELIWKAL